MRCAEPPKHARDVNLLFGAVDEPKPKTQVFSFAIQLTVSTKFAMLGKKGLVAAHLFA
jgi:hypothetical protein